VVGLPSGMIQEITGALTPSATRWGRVTRAGHGQMSVGEDRT
jgi:hypothetical protein